MKSRTLLLFCGALMVFVFLSSAVNQVSWANKENTQDKMRQIVGLPSIAIGNLNPSARNPGLELLCTGLLDVPGGYCFYFTNGVPFVNGTLSENITVGGK
jgi:hypothetical protein